MPVSARDHQQGPDSAPVTLVEYGDFECSYCATAATSVREARRRLGDRLRFVFRHFPLTQVHPRARPAAEAAEAAGAQGKFWEMHETLYEHQQTLDDEHLASYAAALGLDPGRFASDMANQVHAPRVGEDFLSGVRGGVNGTPTFFINGRRHDDAYDLETLLTAIRATLPDGNL